MVDPADETRPPLPDDIPAKIPVRVAIKGDDFDGSFVGPENLSDISEALESEESRVLGSFQDSKTFEGEPEDFGSFVSPLDIEAIQEDNPVTKDASSESRIEALNPKPLPLHRSVPSNTIAQNDFYSRISGELKSIKMELASLKSSVDSEKRGSSNAPSNLELGGGPSAAVGQEVVHATTPIQETQPVEHQRPNDGSFMLDRGNIQDLKKLLTYLDRLLESLPEDKVDEFARSEYFDLYRKIFEFFGLV
jgi:hypothetical protein